MHINFKSCISYELSLPLVLGVPLGVPDPRPRPRGLFTGGDDELISALTVGSPSRGRSALVGESMDVSSLDVSASFSPGVSLSPPSSPPY